MRPKGWRLNPKWIEFYEKKEQERIQRVVMRLKWEAESRSLQMAIDSKRQWYAR